MIFGPQQTITALTNAGTAGYAVATDGVTVWIAYLSGTSIKVATSTNQGYAFNTAGAATVDTNAANTNVMLNEPFSQDPVTGRLHLCWGRNSDVVGQPAVLLTSHSDDSGATWSAAATLDNGVSHGNNRFYRLGVLAYDGVVEVVYTSESSSTFTTDGLWSVKSTDGGNTFGTSAKLYMTGVTCPFEPNAAIGDDGMAHISWYDPQVAANQGGDIYYAQGAWNGSGFQWQAAITQVTSGQTCGRSRVSTSRGVVMLIANTNWGGAAADVGTVRSADNGATWGGVVTQATHTTNALDHPWLVLDGDHGVMLWDDLSTSPLTYHTRLSTDGGATWSAGPVPQTTDVSSDAPKLLTTTDIVLACGTNSSGNVIYAVLPLFSPDPASTTSGAVIDAFNRANENPLSDGGKWSQDLMTGASGACQVVSNVAVRRLGAGNFDRAGSSRNDRTIAAGEVFATIAALTDGEIDVMLADETNRNGYAVSAAAGSFGNDIALGKYTAGTPAGLGTSAIPAAASDKLLLRRAPADVIVLRYDSAAADWKEVLRARDTAYSAGLQPAVNIVGSAAVPSIDDFGGSTLVAPSNTVAPVAGGSLVVGSVLTVTHGTWATAQGATPARYSYQWQSSPTGLGSWSDVARARLPFMTVADATKYYRCSVTATNAYGSATATSNALSPPLGSPRIPGFTTPRFTTPRRRIL